MLNSLGVYCDCSTFSCPSGFGFAALHNWCLEFVDVCLLKSGLIIYSWAGKNGTYNMFCKASSKLIVKHLDESASLFATVNCWLPLQTLRCVYSSRFSLCFALILFFPSRSCGRWDVRTCWAPLPWLLSGSAVVYGGVRVKRCFGAAVNLYCNQSLCNTSKRAHLF